MRCIYKTHSILGEKIMTFFSGICWGGATAFLIYISANELNVFWYIATFATFLIFIYSVYSIIIFFKNTIDYKIVFFEDFFQVKSKKTKYIIEYDKIVDMKLKRSYSIFVSGVWTYLEIDCGISKPIYVMFTQHPNWSTAKVNKLKKISNNNFVKHYSKVLNWTKVIERREKNNIL